MAKILSWEFASFAVVGLFGFNMKQRSQNAVVKLRR